MAVAIGAGVGVGMAVGQSFDSWWVRMLISGLSGGATAHVAYLVVSSKIFSRPDDK